jgi:glyoxylase-like metal-dependent hydrolase (beta-lactamase superfamily II)
MPSTSEIARRYFEALSARDLDAAVACWALGGVDNFVGQLEVTAPDGVRQYFSEVFDAFPDFKLEIQDLTTYRNRTAVRWRATATFAGPGTFQGFEPNGARAGTLDEGDKVAGFRVMNLPGHAPGLIGLFRESDRLALVSDCFYTVDPQTGRKNAARVPHPAFDVDTEQARASIRKLAGLNPSAAWAGHTNPVTGDVVAQLEHAASAPA